ncbi:MAG TPA: protein kinase [Pirellulales bacterium]|nr:protein kinase [Pirellulales bacterium]
MPDEARAADVHESPTLLPDTLPTPGPVPRWDADLADTQTLMSNSMAGGAAAHAPETIGDYRLIRPLGEGGMGLVWEAEQTGSGRRVALKLLSERLPRTPDTVERFLREARTAASISHPRSTFVFGAGEQAGRPYIVMELMPGRTLADVLHDAGPLSIASAIDATLDVIDGLQAAHALGLIHRDVKPSNCFLDSDGRVKVGDFGLSKSLVADTALTQTGAFLGTPQFAAPEQVRGGQIDQRTDIYAVGATLLCLLTGRAPFIGDAAAAIAQIATDPAPRLRSLLPSAPAALERIVARTLAKEPAERFSGLAELRLALLPFGTGGTSIAELGRRMAAFVIDGVASRGIALALGLGLWVVSVGVPTFDPLPGECLVGVMVPFLYFALAEGLWERGVGKWLMGLRVVGAQPQRVRWREVFLRAIFMPGALGLAALSPLYPLWIRAGGANLFIPGFAAGGALLVEIVTNAPMYMFWLACLLTMRKRNGYRGLHELVSGTRVVRLQASARERLQRLPLIVPAALDGKGEVFGPYRVTGRLGTCGAATVYQARDERLSRPVWISVVAAGQPRATPARIAACRPGRPHWLQGGHAAGDDWNAFEAVVGAPLTDVAVHADMPWTQVRQWLLDLADELVAASAEQTLPASSSLELVWIDRGGRLKLLDAPLVPLGASRVDAAEAAAGTPEQAVTLLRAVTKYCTHHLALPPYAQRFVADFLQRPATLETLQWAAEELRSAIDRPAELRWDDRLGVLAVSMWLEFSAYVTLAMLVPWLVTGWVGRADLGVAASLASALLLVPAALGYAFRGGPVFRLTGIEVVRVDGRPAGRWRCAWRGFVAWAPLLLFYTTVGISACRASEFSDLSIVPALCGSELVAVWFLIGVVYAVARPQRGLQDLLAGTRLAPK